MDNSARDPKLGLIFIGIPLVLWILALLFLFRVINIFDRYLMNFPGPRFNGEELEMGLNPGDASDGNGNLDNDGYTNIEEYLHFLSGLISMS